MNGFTENTASGASESLGRYDRVLTWGAAHGMLPLVGRIARDVVRHHAHLLRLRPELARLDRERQALAWPDRARRYQLQEELALTERECRKAVAELEELGVALLDGPAGLVGFPTIVNDRRAYFSWLPDEESLEYWNYAGDEARRPVPVAWTRPTRERSSRGRTRKK